MYIYIYIYIYIPAPPAVAGPRPGLDDGLPGHLDHRARDEGSDVPPLSDNQ